MAVKIVCDLCGEDADETDFVLPSYEDHVSCVVIKKGLPTTKVRTDIKPRAMNLCHEHMKQLANWIDINIKENF